MLPRRSPSPPTPIHFMLGIAALASLILPWVTYIDSSSMEITPIHVSGWKLPTALFMASCIIAGFFITRFEKGLGQRVQFAHIGFFFTTLALPLATKLSLGNLSQISWEIWIHVTLALTFHALSLMLSPPATLPKGA